MPASRTEIRVTAIVEDKRQERFLRRLLERMGFDTRYRLNVRVAPMGQGAAEAWVRRQYAGEVAALRKKNYQKGLGLVVLRDGDRIGVSGRKAELDAELEQSGAAKRQAGERIATPVPTWSIETWLLCLLGDTHVDEKTSRKDDFPPTGVKEREAIRRAVEAWLANSATCPGVPSLPDGKAELDRL